MRKRLTIVMATISVVALATGVAWAAIPPEPVRMQPVAFVANEQTIDVADAGSVTLTQSESTLEIVTVAVNAGWTNEIEVAAGREVEVEFTSSDRRIQFNAELEDGEIRVRVRERTGSTVVETSSTTMVDSTSSTSERDSTSTTVDDSTSTSEDHSTSTTLDDSTSTTVDDDTTSTTSGDSTSTTIDDDTTSTTLDDSTSTTIDDDTPTGSGTETYTVGAVATITIAWSEGQMTLSSVSVAEGWSIEEQEVRSDRVKLEFERGDSEAKFEARFNDGSLRVETEVD